jgi:hypothetical protein
MDKDAWKNPWFWVAAAIVALTWVAFFASQSAHDSITYWSS